MESFARQLNYYGFHRAGSTLDGVGLAFANRNPSVATVNDLASLVREACLEEPPPVVPEKDRGSQYVDGAIITPLTRKAKAIRAQAMGVAHARAQACDWSPQAIARSRAGEDGPALVRDAAGDHARRVPVPDGWSSEVFDAYVEAYASYIHEAAVQAVDAVRALTVASAINSIRPAVLDAARRYGLEHVIGRADFRGRELLSNIGLTEGPDFEDCLTSFVAGVTAIASEVL